MEAAHPRDLVRGRREDARLRAEADPAVAGDHPAARPQAVAVEHRAEGAAVAEGDPGRAVPGFEQAGVVAVETLELGGDVLAVLPGGGDHHHHRVMGGAAAEDHQLERPIEGGGVGDPLVDQRQAVVEVAAEGVGGEHRLPGPHPVDVAADGVDLAVVGDHPQRLGQLPARRRVRREARVDDREGAAQRPVAEVGEELRQLRRRQHPLVDDRPAGHAREEDVGAELALGPAPDHEQGAVEGLLVVDVVAGGDEELADLRRAAAGQLAARGLVDRDLAPADRGVAGLGHQLGDPAPDPLGAPRGSRRMKHIATASRPGPGRTAGLLSISAVRDRKNSCGRPNMIPAPSPVDSSAPAAPRCSSRSSATSARSIVSWIALPSRRADAGDPAAVMEESGVVNAGEALLAGGRSGVGEVVVFASHEKAPRGAQVRCRPDACDPLRARVGDRTMAPKGYGNTRRAVENSGPQRRSRFARRNRAVRRPLPPAGRQGSQARAAAGGSAARSGRSNPGTRAWIGPPGPPESRFDRLRRYSDATKPLRPGVRARIAPGRRRARHRSMPVPVGAATARSVTSIRR